MPLGDLLDFIACHQQYIGMEKPKQLYDLDDVIPFGL